MVNGGVMGHRAADTIFLHWHRRPVGLGRRAPQQGGIIDTFFGWNCYASFLLVLFGCVRFNFYFPLFAFCQYFISIFLCYVRLCVRFPSICSVVYYLFFFYYILFIFFFGEDKKWLHRLRMLDCDKMVNMFKINKSK